MLWFSLEELARLLDGEVGMAEAHEEAQRTVQQRKAAYARDAERRPPRVITSEGEIGMGDRLRADLPPGALAGTAASHGVAEGRARIVRRPEEARLEPGDILVAPFTDPAWTPLFHAARALVMEVGGMMTHGAVVAREYGIPAVVGVDGALSRIPDGARIRVDGTRGYVEILDAPVERG